MAASNSFNPSDLFSAKDLVIVVTGGGSGIGRAFTTALFQTSPRKIYILGRRADLLQTAAREIDPSTHIVEAIPCDISSKSSVLSATDKIEQQEGYIDVLINNAGILGPNHKPAHTAQTVEELQKLLLDGWDEPGNTDGWDQTFRINSVAVGGVSAAFLSLLDKGNQRRGWQGGRIATETRQRKAVEGVTSSDTRTSQIITVASIAGFNRSITAGLAYSGSKAAAIHLSKMLATMLAPWGIRSNVIAPGMYPSEMTAGSKDDYTPQEIPLGMKGTFEDLAGSILFLVGRSGAYLNGGVQVTDGGRLSVHPASY